MKIFKNIGLYARLHRIRHYIFPLSPSLIIHGNYITFTPLSIFNCYFYELFNLNFEFFLTNHREYPTYTAFYSVFMAYLKFSQFQYVILSVSSNLQAKQANIEHYSISIINSLLVLRIIHDYEIDSFDISF